MVQAMDEFSRAVQTCRGRELEASRARLMDGVNKAISSGRARPRFRILTPLLESLKTALSISGDNTLATTLTVVRWCLQNRLIQQGYTILEEGIITYLGEAFGLDPLNVRLRQIITSCTTFHCRKLARHNWNLEEEEKVIAPHGNFQAHRTKNLYVIQKSSLCLYPIASPPLRKKKQRPDLASRGLCIYPRSF